jgi:hypothetical protein
VFHNINVYRETFGVEKTFLDGDASIGLRLPLNTLEASSEIAGLGSSNTDIGDLSIISKFILWQNRKTGSLFSGGLAVTVPTGPDSFAGSDVFTPVHTTVLTPYLSYLWKQDRFYLQGFASIDVPTGEDVTVIHNDIQVGYFLLRNRDCDRLLTAVVPHFEVHINDPLNHRGATNLSDPLGTPDWVDLTSGVTFELRGRSTFSVGLVTPVTGPKPFDFEVLAQWNLRFGASVARSQQQ